MNPLLVVGGGGLGLWLASHFMKKPAPTPASYQTTVVPGTPDTGVTVKVATPVPPAVSPAQATGVPVTAPVPPAVARTAAPVVVPNQGVTYAPPKAMSANPDGTLQLAPIVITPSGASSVAIASTLDVQRALNTLGFQPALQEDGKLGPLTIGNIKQFQGKNNLVVDGNAGPATKAALSQALTNLASGLPGTAAPVAAPAPAAAAPAPATTGGVYSSGAKTPAATPVNIVSAKDVQHALNILGTSPPLVEDGSIGPKSVAAIKSFQLGHGLVADGIAGPKTKTALGQAVAQHAAPAVGFGFGGQFGCGLS